MEEDKRKRAERDVIRAYSRCGGLTPEAAKKSYLTVLRGCKLYGGTHFMVNTESEEYDFISGTYVGRSQSRNRRLMRG